MSRRPVVPLSFTRHGDASRPAVILLQGLGMASNAWPPNSSMRLSRRDSR